MNAFFCNNSCLGIDSFGNYMNTNEHSNGFSMSATVAKVKFAMVALALALGGCADMQHLTPSASLRDPGALAATQALAAADDAGAWPATDWWTAFGDPQLGVLMQEAEQGSPPLAVAAARTRRALAAANAGKAALYPRAYADVSSTRDQFSANGLTPPPYAGSDQTVDQLQVTLTWQADFWGKNRSAYEAALGAARAADVDAHAAALTLTTSLAQAYVQLQRAFEQRDIAMSTLRDLSLI